ncbi:MAG: hypothetical protein JWM17_2231 [Actinobacteria bacterium]|nr:hypothetical protein [Actinomycetota bacterium]MCW3042984.1 hypothetical protein [Actinomycetota bacterium]
MDVGSICERPAVTCSPATTSADAARLMHQHNVGCLIVVHHGAMAGVVTNSVIEVDQDAPAAYAAWQMKANGVHHVVVVIDGEPSGMISSRDLLRGFD